tara:strand:+ start:344 stop:676 length:333 start_codon:yes stop_codon:yes gene_type:complete
MRQILRSYLLDLKIRNAAANKEVIQKVQQVLGKEVLTTKDYRITKRKLSRDGFLSMFANPPEIQDDCNFVHLYAGNYFIQEVDKKSFLFGGETFKTLIKAENFLCKSEFQ